MPCTHTLPFPFPDRLLCGLIMLSADYIVNNLFPVHTSTACASHSLFLTPYLHRNQSLFRNPFYNSNKDKAKEKEREITEPRNLVMLSYLENTFPIPAKWCLSWRRRPQRRHRLGWTMRKLTTMSILRLIYLPIRTGENGEEEDVMEITLFIGQMTTRTINSSAY